MTTLRRAFTLDDERDAELLERLDAEENISAVVREALREHYQLSPLAEIAETLRRIEGALAGRVLLPAAGAQAEDADLAAALEGLGLSIQQTL